jgi:hypothetical protein
MRPLEVLLVGALLVSLLLRWIKPRNRQFTASTIAMLGILVGLHLIFDGPRWEMIPAYAMGAAAAWVLSSDLRRVTGAKAGESSRWSALPSTERRVLTGALLAVAGVAAVAIPLWAFPRIVLPRPDGLYDVGRLDIAWSDSTRPLASGQARPVVLSAWYPAEAPNGRPLRYHPDPAALGADFAAGTPLPGFAFRNLTAARTHSTSEPRFSIREGRSPLVVVSHEVGASRMEGTALFERLASRGYVVISVDHAGSAAGAREPEGVPLVSGVELDAGDQTAQRVADLRFVLDRINRLPMGGPIDTLNRHIRLDRTAVIGRGIGASAAAEMAVLDARVTAAVGIAPDTIAAAASQGVRRPLLVFTPHDPDLSLDDVFRYGGTEVRLDGATRRTLSDLALLGPPVLNILGIESGNAPSDVHAAISALTLRFLDQYLKERTEETEVALPARVRLHVIPHQAR